MLPKPLAWGIAVVLTALEALNVYAAVWVEGYQSDPLIHFTFATIVGFMLGMKEGNTAVARVFTAVRNITTPPPGAPPTPPPGEPPASPQEPTQ